MAYATVTRLYQTTRVLSGYVPLCKGYGIGNICKVVVTKIIQVSNYKHMRLFWSELVA